MRFETRFSYEFIRQHLPCGGHRILEVGCGKGELAAGLADAGYIVVAIDSDPDAVAAARQRGVDAQVATWPDFADGEFDAVLFTQSLHHIHPLSGAVKRTVESLAEGGRMIVEDFDCEATDQKTLDWFSSAIRLLAAVNLLTEPEQLLAKTKTLKAWREDHGHDLHSAAKIGAELDKSGRVVRSNAPYYFRYLARAMVPTEERDTILQGLAEEEHALASDGSIVALGRRFVMTPK